MLVPAKGDGEIVHVFHVDRCRPGWDRDVTDEFGRPQIGGC